MVIPCHTFCNSAQHVAQMVLSIAKFAHSHLHMTMMLPVNAFVKSALHVTQVTFDLHCHTTDISTFVRSALHVRNDTTRR